MALHGIVNTTNMMCWDVDALNMVGINATTDIDNGTLVTLDKIAKTAAGDITGYQYEVKPATANAVNVWLVATPEIGKTLEMQVHDDIRYFYNKAGLPMDIKGIVAGFDCVELDATHLLAVLFPPMLRLVSIVASPRTVSMPLPPHKPLLLARISALRVCTPSLVALTRSRPLFCVA